MTTPSMTRQEALLKLIAVEPVPPRAIPTLTGWPPAETLAELRQLRRSGLVAKVHHRGQHCLCASATGRRQLPGWKLPPAPAAGPARTTANAGLANLASHWKTT